ncbi:hypothetical protein DH2020_014593 [Rehmannia glutinosa]|uniref:S1 motif domain-containing protein n=1 Tax=Rehmannia glutinosa TaxID=99300 RepID=A0ABR0WWV0_REHGL
MGADSVEDGLKKLEYLSLVSKVCTELETHLGFGDKVLAEFITELGRNCQTVEEFDAKLKENGAEMPDYFVRTLLTIIHAILPPKQKLRSKKGVEDGEKSAFSALKIKDSKERVKELEKEIEEDVKSRRRLEVEDEEHKYNRDNGRREKRRDRERERDRYEDRDDYDDDKGGGRYRERDRDMNRDEWNRRNGYDEEKDDRKDSRKEMNDQPQEPELYNVYKGRVSRVMDTGCFVQLDAFKGREGLVHVSQMATRRIGNAKDVVKRDQEVYVKVISVSGNKLSLSMRDVDQNSGKDLLPLKRSEEDNGFRTNPSGRNDGGGMGSRTGLSGIKITEDDDAGPSRRPLKRMSSPERWEAKQLIASGVMSIKEHPMFDEEGMGCFMRRRVQKRSLRLS